MFVLVVLLLHGHVWGSIRVHHLWVHPCFSSSLACLVRITWIVFVIGGRWPYSWCLVGCCRHMPCFHKHFWKILFGLLHWEELGDTFDRIYKRKKNSISGDCENLFGQNFQNFKLRKKGRIERKENVRKETERGF